MLTALPFVVNNQSCRGIVSAVDGGGLKESQGIEGGTTVPYYILKYPRVLGA